MPKQKRSLPRNKAAWLTLKTGEHAGKTICALCHRQRVNEDDPDPCLGYLPGVVNACCGHGVQAGYLIFENGIGLTFHLTQLLQYIGPASFDQATADAFAARRGKVVARPLVPFAKLERLMK